MTSRELEQLVGMGEGFTLEFKQGGTTQLGRELCAFANATGGIILIGVTDDGRIIGVQGQNKLKSEIQAIARSVEPPLLIDIDAVDSVLVVSIPAQTGKPYSFAGKFYLRDGASSQQMSRSEIREFFFKEGVIHFDETPCDRFSPETDLDKISWDSFSRRAKIPPDMDRITALRNLHLLSGDRMTHAGAWLLAKDIRKFTTSADVSCALFLGTDKVRILDRQDFSGDIYSMIDAVVTYILAKINVELIIKHVKREERPELPEEALREAVVNALAHRDYRSTANVQIYIFKDRVEIVSPGGLPAGMLAADLGKKSVPRNPLLFGMLYRMDAVEHIGSGIKRIRDICKAYGVAPPNVLAEENWVTVTFFRNQPERSAEQGKEQAHVEAYENQTGTKSEPSTPQAPRKYPASTPQVRAILAVASPGEVTREQLQIATGMKDREHFRKEYLNVLLNCGLLDMTIPDKPRSSRQRYRLTAKGREFLRNLEGEG